MKCPNKNNKTWKYLEERFGVDGAYAIYLSNNHDIPTSLESIIPLMEASPLKTQVENEVNRIKGLRSAIENQLKEIGVGVGALTQYEQNRGINGLFDPSSNETTADGLRQLIRVAQGTIGDITIVEEYAHLANAILKSTGNPIYNRLDNLVRNNEVLIEDILNTTTESGYRFYSELYSNNTDRLADEAIGKLIEKHIVNQSQSPAPVQTRTLLQRLKDFFNRLFGKGDSNLLQKQIYQANELSNQLAVDLMGEQINLRIDLNSIRNQHLLYNATQQNNQASKIVNKAIELEHKRSKIAESRALTEQDKQKNIQRNIFIERLEVMNNHQRFNHAIVNILENAYGEMKNLMDSLNELQYHKDSPVSDFTIVASKLKELQAYLQSYTPIVEDIYRYMSSSEYNASENMVDIESLLNDFSTLLRRTEVQYEDMALPLFRTFVKQFTSDIIGKTIGGVLITEVYLDSVFTESMQDISLFERWAHKMGSSSDLLLRMVEQPIKTYNREAQQKALEYQREIFKLQEDLEKAGYKNTDFVAQKVDGKYTGRIIQEINWDGFYIARNSEIERLNRLYPQGRNDARWWTEYNKWLDNNATKAEDGTIKPLVSKWANSKYKSLSQTQQHYIKEISRIKEELDKLLPPSKVLPYYLPQVRKDWWDRMRQSNDWKTARNHFREGMKDKVKRRESDDEFGTSYGLENFAGGRYRSLPIHYTTRLDDMSQLSTDVTSSMIMYAAMATRYDAMNKVVDIMEVGSDVISNRKVARTQAGKPMVERIKHKGREIENKIFKSTNNRTVDRFEDFMDIQVYGQMSDDNIIKVLGQELSTSKVSGTLMGLTALNAYAFSMLAGTANVAISQVHNRVEAISGQFFNQKDLVKANAKYFSKYLPQVVSELTNRRKKTFANLILQEFEILQNFEKDARNPEANRRGLARLLTSNNAFFLNHMGEHYLHTKVFLQVSSATKLLDANKKEIELDEAFEVYVNDRGIETLRIKEGITNLDGSAFTQQDIHKISRKVAAINHEIQGIYNVEDRAAAQKTAIGKMAFMFRKWLPPALKRRFGKEMYSFDKGTIEEGYYTSFGRLLTGLYQDLKAGQFFAAARWKHMTEHEKQNFKKVMVEIGAFIMLLTAGLALGRYWEDDDDSWAKSYALYTINRLRSEVGILIPGPSMLREGYKIYENPTAVLRYVTNVSRALNPVAWWDDPIQSGQFEGWNRGARNLFGAMPYVNPIRRAMHPDEALKFYRFNR